MNDAARSRWLEWWMGRPGTWAALAWGFAEGTLFFIVPDVLFTLTTALRPRRGLLQLALAVAGAIPAGLLMYSWAELNPQQAYSAVNTVPFVRQFQFEETARRFETERAGAMLSNPLGGVPYKLYAVLAPSYLSLTQFMLISVPARAERMLVTWIPAALIGLVLRRFEESQRLRIAIRLYAFAWIAIYAVYWSKLWPM